MENNSLIQKDIFIGNLSQNYGTFFQFSEQDKSREISIQFESTNPISVYFVPSKEDFSKFIQDEEYSNYPNCFFENKDFEIINCNVSSGGIIFYNPNLEKNVNYTITLLEEEYL